MRISAEIQEEWLGVVRLEGELDAYSGAELRDVVDQMLGSGASHLLVDLSELQYIDSVGLGILMGGAKRAGQRGGDIAVACNRPNLLRVFSISGAGELLNVRSSPDEALAVLRERRCQNESARAEEGESDAGDQG